MAPQPHHLSSFYCFNCGYYKILLFSKQKNKKFQNLLCRVVKKEQKQEEKREEKMREERNNILFHSD